MWVIYMFIALVMAVFIALDIYFARVWDVFAARGYDMLNMAAGDRKTHPSWFHRRGEEYTFICGTMGK